MEKDLNVKLSKNSELGQLLNINNETYEFQNNKQINLENISDIF